LTFVSGHCIDLQPGFHATAGTAGTTFHAWVETAPTADSVWPLSGNTLSQQFTWKASSPSGYTNLLEMYALFNTSVSGQNACYIRYNRASNLLYLADNASSTWLGGLVPGTSGTAANSQCSLAASGSSASGSGNQLTLMVSVTFQTSFSGAKNDYLIANDQYGLNSGWQQMGTWTLPAPQQYYLTTAVSPAGGGTISPASGWYNSGTVVTVSATANSGYQFTGFSGDLSGTTTPQNLTMNGPKSVTANFTVSPQPPQAVSVSPSSGTGLGPQTFQFVYSDPNGYADLASFYGRFNATASDAGACSFRYDRASNNLYLWNDAGTAWLGPYALGSQVANSQCTLGAGSTTPSGNNLTLNLTIAFRGSFAGGKYTYLQAVDASAASSGWQTKGTWTVPAAPGAGIYSSAVEINLAAFPIDRYFDANIWGGAPLINGCSTSITVQACVQQLFSSATNNWWSQGVTGVRFFFTLANGHHSDPFDAQGNVKPDWSNKLESFFKDLRKYGIQRITPTPVFDTWSGPRTAIQERVVTECDDPQTPENEGVTVTRYFVDWLPYGLEKHYPPDCPTGVQECYWAENTCMNKSYKLAAQNQTFWGWTRFFNVMNVVLAKASLAGLAIDALDYFQESSMIFTVQARMIYDDDRDVDVLQELRTRMAANGFNPDRVAPSANQVKPTVASFDCGSYYGESAMLLHLSELTAAISGPWGLIGEPSYANAQNNLACDAGQDQFNLMIALPVWHSQPTFIDIHSQAVYSSLSDTATRAKNFYSDIWAFMYNRGRTGDYVVFGETNPVGCGSEWTSEQASAMLYGMAGESNGYKNSLLFANRAGSVVMRPWHRTEYGFACPPSPHVINPPFNPFNP
jgi:hypothetical protein